MTNADRIRKMTDEELADMLGNQNYFFSCKMCEKPGKRGRGDTCMDCRKWIMKFLQKECEE